MIDGAKLLEESRAKNRETRWFGEAKNENREPRIEKQDDFGDYKVKF